MDARDPSAEAQGSFSAASAASDFQIVPSAYLEKFQMLSNGTLFVGSGLDTVGKGRLGVGLTPACLLSSLDQPALAGCKNRSRKRPALLPWTAGHAARDLEHFLRLGNVGLLHFALARYFQGLSFQNSDRRNLRARPKMITHNKVGID